MRVGVYHVLDRWCTTTKWEDTGKECCSRHRNGGRRDCEFCARERVCPRAGTVYWLPGCLVVCLRIFLALSARSMGICVGPIWLHDGHRRYTGGINAGFCIRRDLEPGGKHHHRNSFSGYDEDDRISSISQVALDKTG